MIRSTDSQEQPIYEKSQHYNVSVEEELITNIDITSMFAITFNFTSATS